MLIKSVTKKGDAVPYAPEEALSPAVSIAVAKKLNKEFVFWVGQAPTKTSFRTAPTDDKGGYEAFAEGVVGVGKTRIKDDKFFLTKPHSFKIHYRSSKDEIGAPHLDVVDFSLEPVQSNPSKAVGAADAENAPVSAQVVGELVPTPVQQQGGGSPSSKKATTKSK